MRLSPDLKYTHVFTLPNMGSQDLVVQTKSKSCDCLSAEIDREVIKPGEAAAVTLAVKPNDLVNKQATVTIATDDGATHVYRLQSRTYPPVMLNGGTRESMSFGLLPPGSCVSGRHRLAVHADAGKTLPALSFRGASDGGHVRCTLSELGIESIEGGRILRRNYALDVEVTTDQTPGLNSDYVTFLPIDSSVPEYELTARVMWNVRSQVTLDPPRWMMKRRELAANAVLRQAVHLRVPEGCSVQLVGLESSHSPVKVTVGIPPDLRGDGESATAAADGAFAVSLDPTGVPKTGPFVGTVTVRASSSEGGRTFATTNTFKVILTD